MRLITDPPARAVALLVGVALVSAISMGRLIRPPNPAKALAQARAARPDSDNTTKRPESADCPQPTDWRRHFASASELKTLLTGAWLRCSAERKTWGGMEHAGIEFTAEGRWYLLQRDARGVLVRGWGIDYEGDWSIQDTAVMNGPGIFQVTFQLDRGGRIGVLPHISGHPRMLHLDNSGVERGDYVSSPVTPQPSSPPANDEPSASGSWSDSVAAACRQPAGPRHRFSTAAELKALITGAWLFCSGNARQFSREDQIGVEFDADGRWYIVLRDTTGRLVRGRGLDYEGTWSIQDMSVMDGPGSFSLNMQFDGSGFSGMSAVFSDHPRKLRLNSTGGKAEYIPSPLAPSSEAPTPAETTSVDPVAGWPPAACRQHNGSWVRFSTPDELKTFITGKWLLCVTEATGSAREAPAGIEVTPAGRWYYLRWDAEGQITRSHDLEDAGELTIMDTSAMNGPGAFQAMFKTNGGRTVGGFPVFSSPPFKMRLISPVRSDYMLWERPP